MYTSTIPLLRGEKESGVTFHCIDEGIDTGDILFQKKFRIELTATAKDLYTSYLLNGEKLFKKHILQILRGSYIARKQSAINASYFSKTTINYKDIEIDLRKTSFEIHNQLRAYIFSVFQLPTIDGKAIIKSELTEQKTIKYSCREEENRFVIGGIDGYVVFACQVPLFWDRFSEISCA